MLNCDQGWTKTRAEFLMELTGCVTHYLQKPEDVRHIPALLARALELPAVSLAVVRTAAEGTSILLSAFSDAETPPYLQQDLLYIHRQTQPLSVRDGLTLRPAIEPSEMDLRHPDALPHLTVFTQAIDERHRMLLVIHTRAGEPPLAADHTEILQLLTRQLGRSLKALVIWMARPRILGAPFNHLTDHEWMVVRQLHTDGNEKQLANQLSISVHTLHSHVKSIYRKVGVQGRLALLRRVDEALRELRLGSFKAQPSVIMSHSEDEAVAVG
jgi:hypothetical protein